MAVEEDVEIAVFPGTIPIVMTPYFIVILS